MATAGVSFISAAREYMGPKLPPPSYGNPEKCDPKKLRSWQVAQLMYEHPYRLRQCATWRYAELFDQDIQWLCRSYNVDTTMTQHWTRVIFRPNYPNAIPTPVYNEVSEPIENEAARLGKPEYKPYARSDENADLKVRTGGKLAEDALQFALKEMGWSEQEDLGLLHMPLYGQWLVMSYWDQDMTNTVRLPVLSAMQCPTEDCDFKTAKPEIDERVALDIDPALAPRQSQFIGREEAPNPAQGAVDRKQVINADKKSEHTEYSLNRCPQCETHDAMELQELPDPMTGEPVTQMAPMEKPGGPKLVPFTPIDDELYDKDSFGREMGRDVALGEWKMRTMFPDQVFPENLGVDQQNGHVQSWHYVHPERLDWIKSHHSNGYLVKPETPEEIMRYHPITGERAIFFGNYVGSGVGIFRNYCRVRESYIDPWVDVEKDKEGKPLLDSDGRPTLKKNHGRTLIMAGDTVLFDGDLEIQSQNDPSKWIPRVHLEDIVWKPRSGGREFHGVSLSEHLFDMQENVNEMGSQIQDCRQTMGFPSWSAPRGMNLRYNRGDRAGGIWQFDYDPSYGNVRPEVIGNELLNSQVYQELEWMLQYKQRAGNTQAVETGGVPPGVAAALAIQMLSEQTGERRRSRIRRIREAYERLYSHGLDLMHELVREPRDLWKEIKDGSWTQASWTGLDLMGITEVKIKAEPDHDSEIQVQQAVRDGLEAGLFDLTDARTRRLVGREIGVKSEIFEQQDLQENSAEREFTMWMDEDDPPVRNEDIDDDMDHYERHVIDVLDNEEWRDLEKQAGWKSALAILSGWNKPMNQPPQPTVDPATGMVVMIPPPTPFEAFMSTEGMMMRTQLTELQILGCWRSMLMAAQDVFLPTPEQAKPLAKCMRFFAHIAGHRRAMEEERMAAAQGAQIAAAPGGNATSAGTVPSGGGGVSGAPPGPPMMPQPPPSETPGSQMGA